MIGIMADDGREASCKGACRSTGVGGKGTGGGHRPAVPAPRRQRRQEMSEVGEDRVDQRLADPRIVLVDHRAVGRHSERAGLGRGDLADHRQQLGEGLGELWQNRSPPWPRPRWSASVRREPRLGARSSGGAASAWAHRRRISRRSALFAGLQGAHHRFGPGDSSAAAREHDEVGGDLCQRRHLLAPGPGAAARHLGLSVPLSMSPAAVSLPPG